MALTDNLISVWHMNNDWQDSFGTNHGTAYGATFSASSKLGSHAGSFDGIDDRVEIADSTSLDVTGSMAISAWVNTTTIGLDYQCIFAKGITSRNFGFYIRDSRIHFQFYSGGSWRTHASPAGGIAIDNYYHVVVSLDTVADVIKMYINNVEVYSAAETNLPVAQAGVARIGFDGGAEYFSGREDEINFWKDRHIVASEVAELWNGGTGIELGAAGQPINLRGAFIPGMRQWQPNMMRR